MRWRRLASGGCGFRILAHSVGGDCQQALSTWRLSTNTLCFTPRLAVRCVLAARLGAVIWVRQPRSVLHRAQLAWHMSVSTVRSRIVLNGIHRFGRGYRSATQIVLQHLGHVRVERARSGCKRPSAFATAPSLGRARRGGTHACAQRVQAAIAGSPLLHPDRFRPLSSSVVRRPPF